MFRKEIRYSLKEFCKYTRMTKTEQVMYDFCKDMDKLQIDITKNKRMFNTIALTFANFLLLEQKVLAAPSTGFPGLDNGAYQIVKVVQACVFWVSLLYTLKSLLLLTVRGEGEWRKVATGFLICIGNYLVPWLFGMVPGLFKF